MKHFRNQRVHLLLLLSLALAAVDRVIFLVIDAYSSTGRLPALILRLLYLLPFVCFTSSFAVLLASSLDLSRHYVKGMILLLLLPDLRPPLICTSETPKPVASRSKVGGDAGVGRLDTGGLTTTDNWDLSVLSFNVIWVYNEYEQWIRLYTIYKK